MIDKKEKVDIARTIVTFDIQEKSSLHYWSLISLEVPERLDASIVLLTSVPSSPQLDSRMICVYMALLSERGHKVFMVRLDEAPLRSEELTFVHRLVR